MSHGWIIKYCGQRSRCDILCCEVQMSSLHIANPRCRYICLGDQIGRIFTYWAIVYLVQFFREEAQMFWLLYFHGKSCVLNLTPNGLGSIWGAYFKNLFGYI
jgi:hypothetical protein